jgi:hypothetical protein
MDCNKETRVSLRGGKAASGPQRSAARFNPSAPRDSQSILFKSIIGPLQGLRRPYDVPWFIC